MPVEADYRRELEYVNGNYEKIYSHKKITEFIINPDHEALGSFKHDFIPNGARVRLAGVSGITYTWQDGKVFDKDGHEVDIKNLIPSSPKGKD